MDKTVSVHHRKAGKQSAKAKKKGLKVVYISNPMKIKTSASEFRALVQELTGQDADMPDPSKYSGIIINGSADAHQVVPHHHHHHATSAKLCDDHASVEVPTVMKPEMSDLAAEPYDDDVFTTQMMENFTASLPSVGRFHESADDHVDVFTSLDAM